ncbi:MAG: uroporphyrinogen decarboxylase [Inquilinaceae bacterium]
MIRALTGWPTERPPFWLMRQAGRYLAEYRDVRSQAGSFLDLCYNPSLAAEVTLQPVRRFGMDGAILFSDILVVPHGLGQRLDYVEGEGPRLEPVTDRNDLSRLSLDRLHDVVGPVYETVSRVRAALPDTTALIGFAGGPWTVATYMVEGGGSKDFALVKRFAYGDPAGFKTLIDLVVDATIAYLDRQAAAGAEILQVFDSWAGVLAEDEFANWVTEPTRRIVAALHDRHPAIPIVGFPRGAGLMYDRYVTETGVDAVGLDGSVPLSDAMGLQRRLPVQGNLDPALLWTGGDAMLSRIDTILSALGHGPFVFNLGHGVIRHTPPEHVAALADHIRAWPDRRDATSP